MQLEWLDCSPLDIYLRVSAWNAIQMVNADDVTCRWQLVREHADV